MSTNQNLLLMKYLLLSFVFIWSFGSGFAQNRIDYSNFQRVLHDDFKYQNHEELAQNWSLKPADVSKTIGSAIFTGSQISFLPEGGIRLTATPLSQAMAAREPNGKQFYYKSALISRPLKEAYGIFEIIAQIPDGQKNLNDAWPVFKLVGENTEINIIDGHGAINDDLRQNVSVNLDKNTQYQCGNNWNLEDFHAGWDKDYHVFQAAWTPDAITLFIHGREVATVKADQLNIPMESMRLVVALQTDEAGSQPIHFDIKEINIYRHKPNAPFHYLKDKSWAFHQATGTLYDPKVLDQNGAIVPNPNQPNEVFYIGDDHQVYLAEKTNQAWTNQSISNTQILGDLVYNPVTNTLLFKNLDGSLGGFHRQGNQFLAFQKSNIQLAKAKKALAVSNEGNVIAILKNGNLAYLDPTSYAIKAMAKVNYRGDLTVAPNETVLFKDNGLQLRAMQRTDLTFRPISLPNVQVSAKPGAILYTTFPTGQGIAFRGQDDQFHQIQQFGTHEFEHTMPAYDYGFQDPQHKDYIASNLAGGRTDIFYISEDGRLQLFGWDYDRAQRIHYWVDDNFFTQAYLADTQAPSLAFGAGGQVYYRTQTGSLGYFQWEATKKSCDCQTLHKDSNSLSGLDSEVDMKVFPNPTAGRIKMTLTNGCQDCTTHFELVAANGQRIQKGSFEGTEHVLNIETQPAGIYQLNMTSEAGRFSKQIVKLK